MTERVGVTACPLYWPAGWKRAARRERSKFRDSSVYAESQEVRKELAAMYARDVVISSNLSLRSDGLPYSSQRIPDDPGVSVWFELRESGEWREHVLACDRWDRAEHNLRAIAKHVEALRGQDRWGVGSLAQAFRGYQALPEQATGRPWWDVLKVPPDADAEKIEQAYKHRALECHPDKCDGDRQAWDELLEARAQANAAKKES